jgi:hypothetical protein
VGDEAGEFFRLRHIRLEETEILEGGKCRQSCPLQCTS